MKENKAKVGTNRGFTVQKYIFLAVILIIPIINWVLFWLVVNVRARLLGGTSNIFGRSSP